MKFLIATAVFAFCLFILFTYVAPTASRPSENATTSTAVRFSNIYTGCELINFVAKEKGYFAEQGLDVTFETLTSSNQAMDALIAGRIDVAGCVAYPVAFSVESTQPGIIRPVRSVITSPEHPFVWLVAKKDDASINGYTDLAGKTVGHFPGSTTEILLRHILRKVGVDPDTVTTVSITAAQQVAALESGSVDALFAIEPVPTISVLTGTGKMIDAAENYFPDPRYNAMNAVLVSYAEANPETIEKIKRAQDQAVDYMRANQDEARKILARFTPYDEATVMQAETGWVLKSDEAIDFEKLQEYADILYEGGEFDQRLDVRTLFD